MINTVTLLLMLLVLSGCSSHSSFSPVEMAALTIPELTVHCEAGAIAACNEAGLRYLLGRETVKDPQQAVRYYSTSCRFKDRNGCKILYDTVWSYLYRNEDPARIAELFTQSCDGHYGPACTSLADNYRKGLGVKKNPSKALEYYELGCENRSVTGCGLAGDMVMEGKATARDLSRARQLYEKGCQRDDSGACRGLGLIYLNGDGGARDDARAFSLLVKSCNKVGDDNDNLGCYTLGTLYELGIGCEPNPSEAVRAYRNACYLVKPKNGLACVKLARAYQSGGGVEPDANAAHEYFRQACDLGIHEGCVEQYRDECRRLKHPRGCNWLKRNGLH